MTLPTEGKLLRIFNVRKPYSMFFGLSRGSASA